MTANAGGVTAPGDGIRSASAIHGRPGAAWDQEGLATGALAVRRFGEGGRPGRMPPPRPYSAASLPKSIGARVISLIRRRTSKTRTETSEKSGLALMRATIGPAA